MTDFTPEKIKQFFEQAAKSSTDAWNAQAGYLDGLVRRNTKCFTSLADVRMASLREMVEAKTFNQAFEANLAFDETVREELDGLQDKNAKAWEGLQKNLKAIYTPVIEEAKKVAPGKASVQLKKAVVKKAAPNKAALKKTAPKKAAATKSKPSKVAPKVNTAKKAA